MKLHRLASLLFLCAVILISFIVKAQNKETSITIEGTVVGSQNAGEGKAGLPGAKVVLMDKSYKIILSRFTNKSGKFALQASPNTQYYMVAEKKGYASKRVAVNTASGFDAVKDAITLELFKPNASMDNQTATAKNETGSETDNVKNEEEKKAEVHTSSSSSFYVVNNAANSESKTGYSSPASPVQATTTGIVFKVQFGKFLNPAPVKFFAGVPAVEIYREDGYIVYTSGHYRTLFEATDALKEVKSKGHNNAFVVAYMNDRRIPTSEAAALAPKQ